MYRFIFTVLLGIGIAGVALADSSLEKSNIMEGFTNKKHSTYINVSKCVPMKLGPIVCFP